MPLRSLVSHVGKESREAGIAALVAVGLPDTGVLALSDRGVHLLTAGGPFLLSPGEEVLFLAHGSYTATSEHRAFTVLLSLQLPSGKTVQYESSRYGMPWPTIAAFDGFLAVVAASNRELSSDRTSGDDSSAK